MQYRSFGKLDWKPSALGFGAMRLPTLSKRERGSSTHDMADINEPLAIEMIRTAIDSGVNYVDTARPYHQGQSEIVVGKALRDGYRNRVKLATKLTAHWIQTEADFDPFLDDQLSRLQTDHIDMYLLHGLGKSRWERLLQLGVLDWAERAIADGRIGHLGFSFHDDLRLFKQIVDAYDWTFCQIIYNYMDIEFQAGEAGLRFAADKGLAVSIMEPLRGGQLARTPLDCVARIWDQAAEKRTPTDWALQWLWNQPEVSIVLSGMSTMEQVFQNIASAERSHIGCLSSETLGLYAAVRHTLQALSPIPCTDCRYCQPCPQGVNIPGVFSLYNEKVIYGEEGAEITAFSDYGNTSKTALKCVRCGACENSCPQQIPIVDWLEKVIDFFAIEAQ